MTSATLILSRFADDAKPLLANECSAPGVDAESW
jgi:hypothetical protein